MASIADQKDNLRDIIHNKLARVLEEHPEQAARIAIEATTRLSGRMTLKELQQWNHELSMLEMWG
jgi:hypothetical protein